MESVNIVDPSEKIKEDEKIRKELINFLHLISLNKYEVRTKIKGIESKLIIAVEKGNNYAIFSCQDKLIKLLADPKFNLSEEARAQMGQAIICDVKNLNPNWWSVKSLIGVSTSGQLWGYSWSYQDQRSFIEFTHLINNDKSNKFTELAKKMRYSEETRDKNMTEFRNVIDGYQKKIEPQMSKDLVNVIIEKSSYPNSRQELENFLVSMMEPLSW
ncbi:hypothetical protein [Aquimarina aquimarini]|uniref:hypothetical protein n=1 Tax=Aquimarina aquimarini TaxID=1191734 RepID=UPI000D55F3AE|nr:hypothetical protein [Aquimarina aquimarini]